MPTYELRGINVDFPFEAYDCQLVYMESVIEALQKRCNALLESPTGTGKTLCLLCATLAWRKSLGGFSTGTNQRKSQSDLGSQQSRSGSCPTIVYASRTHSQLRQVVQELKRCNYRPKMVVLGSREQFCIHDDVSLLRGKAQTNACRILCRKLQKNQKRHCTHFPQVADYMKNNPHIGDEPLDIEDLVNIGRRFGPCPYYVSRELHRVVDIVFAPYNYLIDRDYRKSLNLEWENSILIFDEAHNLDGICADAASFDLSSSLLTACISEAQNCIDLAIARQEESSEKSKNPDNFAILRALLLKLQKRIADIPIESKELGFTKPGPYIYELLDELNITHDTASKLIDTIEEATVLLEEDKQYDTMGSGSRLEIIGNILKSIFRDKGNGHADYYRVHVQEAEVNATDIFKGNKSRTLSWWCFNPGIAMQEFSKIGVGSIILTSGTLHPLDSFAQELKLDFPVRLENPHVISSNQIWAGVISVGPSGCPFNSSYRNRDSPEYKQELGNAIVNFARIVPDGLLVFFPSYYLLDNCINFWKNVGNPNSATIWERICKFKKPVIEPRQSSLFPQAIEDYMTKLKETSTSGAVFFAVCRGKVSEGLDFADHAGRAVVVIGMPFATWNAPKVRLKRDYLDLEVSHREGCKMLKLLTGEEWYNQQASRAVNQAVGRVIRHRHDYGAIIFCDERFAHRNRQSQVSAWIQPHIKCYTKFGDVVLMLTRFFRDGGNSSPAKLELADHGNMGSRREIKTAQLLDKSCLELSTATSTPMDQPPSKDKLSSLLEVKRSNNSNLLGDIVPANLSCFTPCMELKKLKRSNDLMDNKKKLSINERGKIKHQKQDIIDLTSDHSLYKLQRLKEEFLYSAKKHRALGTELDSLQHGKSSDEYASDAQISGASNLPFMVSSVKPEKLQISGARSVPNAKANSSAEPRVTIGTADRDAMFLCQKSQVQLSAEPTGAEETKGSAFLIQVKQKLSVAEYKEFVRLMKVLKSEGANIANVLQCIIGLFSGPGRLPLYERFKDYIPVKYHSLYEQQYLEKSKEMLDNRRN